MGLPVTTGRGFVISDVELKFTPSGQAVANFPVAFKDRKKNGDEWDDIRNTVYRMTAWGKLAEQINDSVQKLTEVDISFKGYEDSYEKDGETRKTLNGIVVSCSPSIEKRDKGGFGSNQKSNPSESWGSVPSSDGY